MEMEYGKFIEDLEKDHVIIQQVLKKLEPIINNKNISDTANILEEMKQLKDVLIDHLKNEDDIFYPDMRKRAVDLHQDALLHAIDLFISDMKDISEKVFDFFSRYDGERAILADREYFISSIAEIRDILTKRIHSEEKTIYRIYKAYHNI